MPHNSALGMFDVSLGNVVKAPYFIFGTHTNADWVKGIRDLPAPWAELEVPGSIIFSVPSANIR